MKGKEPSDRPRSILHRLRNRARERGENPQFVLQRYGLERWLYRLGRSRHRDRLILKGAMLFYAWMRDPHRATNDVDFLGHGDMSEERLRDLVAEVCNMSVEPDGMRFDPGTIRVDAIREDNVYGGLRVSFEGWLGESKVRMQVDVGSGDTVTPHPIEHSYPVLLDHPAPNLRTYSRESVVAEKFEAMVKLGMFNSRMKDFYDLWTLARHFEFDQAILAEAICATFKRRRTELPATVPTGLTDDFADAKAIQWQAFLGRIGSSTTVSLREVVALLREFLLPLCRPENALTDTRAKWSPVSQWT